jgi:hypothetical protein
LGVVLSALPACWFAPDVARYGYDACADDAECAPGRTCEEALCAPPPWHDADFGVRRLLVVENPSEATIPRGAAVPVPVGAEGVLALDEVEIDARVAAFDEQESEPADAWSVTEVFRDIEGEDDRYRLWIPLARDLGPKRRAALGWLEMKTFEEEPTLVEDPASVFALYDAFDDPTLPGWTIFDDGAAFVVEDGVATVGDNQRLTSIAALAPPVQATFVLRVNGLTCDEVFVGLVADPEASFPLPPMAGLFVDQDLNGALRVGPEETSTPQDFGDVRAPTGVARLTVGVDHDRVSAALDGAAFADEEVRPGFGDDPLFVRVQVGGVCTVDVLAAWTTPSPLPGPAVEADAPVTLQLAYE